MLSRLKLIFCSILIWLLFECFQLLSADTFNSEVVTLPNGSRLKGIALKSKRSERPYVEFRNIRYAHKPTEELIFKPPVLLDENLGDVDATEHGNICPQLDPWYNPDEEDGGSWEEMKVLGDEDCLQATIATPNIKPTRLLPVLVWIHGGNFNSESGQDYGPGKLMDYDVCVASFNYRIGPLGFLNLNNEIAAGNLGLKDQVILLQWVKKFIKFFGGDPDNITLAGSNAGAVSVHLHMLSDMSKGLFHQAVIQSGTAISPWAMMKNPEERNRKLAKLLACRNDTNISTCLMERVPSSLVQKTYRMAEWFLDPMVPFGPSVETVGKIEDRFLTRNPYSILLEGNYWAKDIPVIMGINSHEGLLYAMDIGHEGMLRKVFNLEWFRAAPISLYYSTTAMNPRSVSEDIRHYYFPLNATKSENGTVTPTPLVGKTYNFDNLTMLYSDRHFFIPVHHCARLMGRFNKNLALYWFDYVSGQSIHGLYGYNESRIFGPSHYDQIQYLFETPFFNETKNPDHLQFEKLLLDGFYNFLVSGKVNDQWVTVTEAMVEGEKPLIYNRIGKPSKKMQIEEPFTERMKFWNSLFIMEYDRESFIDQVIGAQESLNNAKEKDEL